jgi:hypothetical protein
MATYRELTMTDIPLNKETNIIQKAIELSENIDYSIKDIMEITNKPYRWLSNHEVIFSVLGVSKYLSSIGISVPDNTIRSYTTLNEDGSLNRFEQDLLGKGIKRQVHRKKFGKVPNGMRFFTRAEARLLGSL